jgi:hypothetical protein
VAARDFDPEGKRLPIKIEPMSNGEYVARPLTRAQRLARDLAQEAASENARRMGLARRAFMVSACGAASALIACNRANAVMGARGGFFAVADDAATDLDLAMASVGGDEFIFDVQTHCVDPAASWARGRDGDIWRQVLTEMFGQRTKCTDGSFDCYSAQQLAKEVFLDSDTDAAVVSALWGKPGNNPTPVEYAAEAREVMDAIGGEGARTLIHGGVFPNEPGDIEAMDEKAQRYKVDAWKLYPQWGPERVGLFLDPSADAARMFDRARQLGVKTIAVHKGVPLPGLQYEQSSPRDMGPAAAANPDLTFLVYHSGWEPGVPEGPYNAAEPKGVDRLIRSHQDAGLKRNEGNLYAELGSTWNFFRGRPDEAAHLMGKLLKYFGEDRIMWGTDALWAGSPQDQIQAFRAFEISEEFQERYGYPALTKMAKAKIFGLNGARVYGIDVKKLKGKSPLLERRSSYREAPNPSFATFGPKNRREFLSLWEARGGRPG